jgi:hypothetical protein
MSTETTEPISTLKHLSCRKFSFNKLFNSDIETMH